MINNLEFDHADIFDDISDIQRQFHHLIRMVPSNGLILSPLSEQAIEETLTEGCWTPTEFSVDKKHTSQGWYAEKLIEDGSEFIVNFKGTEQGRVKWDLIGDFNIDNGLMAIAAARHAGVPSHIAIEALGEFINTKRRLELRGTINDIKVFDDFAHHPTAISKTLDGLRAHVGDGRILTVLEPRSNTMKSGIHKDKLASALSKADHIFLFQGENVHWSVDELAAQCSQPFYNTDALDQLIDEVATQATAGDTILVMSNGGFGGFHTKLLERLSLV